MKIISNKKNISKKDLLTIRIVLDRSGSMQGSQEITIDALNTYLNELKQENSNNTSLTLSTFDSMSIDIPISRVLVSKLNSFPADILQPRGGTPLFDAIGLAIHDLENIKESILLLSDL